MQSVTRSVIAVSIVIAGCHGTPLKTPPLRRREGPLAHRLLGERRQPRRLVRDRCQRKLGAGHAHVLVNDAPQIAPYFYLTNGSGTWTSEDITSVLGDQSVLPRLLVTADGTVHLVGVGAHVWRVGGTWKKETLPADSADYAVSGFEAAALDDKGALYLAWEYLPPMAGQPDKVVTLSSANGWTESITEIGHGAVRQQTPILLFDAHGALRVFPIHYERLQYLTTVVSQCPSSR